MPAQPSPTQQVANYFRSRRNQFQKNTSQRIWRTNVFKSLVPTRQYAGEDGENPTIVEYTNELPVSYPFKAAAPGNADTLADLAMVPIGRTKQSPNFPGENSGDATDPNAVVAGAPLGTAPGSPAGVDNPDNGLFTAGNPKSHKIKTGQEERTFEIRETSFSTEAIDLNTIKRAWQAAEKAGAWEKGLRNFIHVFYSDWYRIQNIGMVSNKIIAGMSAITENDYNESFSALNPVNNAPAVLTWDMLKDWYYYLCRIGVAEEMAIGTSAGRPVLPLLLGPETKAHLWKDAQLESSNTVFENMKWHDPKSNLALLGSEQAINGFMPYVDLFPVRYDAGLEADADDLPIYPTVNVATSHGYKHTPNSAYNINKGAATSGTKYEVATILPPKVYECVFEPSGPTAFANMKFDPQDYTGEFHFINNKTFEGNNDRGNYGYYLADVRIGAKPIYPYLGLSILHKIPGSNP